MITPVVGHVTCHLDQQRRLIEARREGRARRAARRRGWPRRLLARPRSAGAGRGHADLHLGSPGEDVWGALRF